MENRHRNLTSWAAGACVGLLVVMGAVGTAAAAASNFTYTYDAYGRLASVSYSSGTTTYLITYSYDKAGNRTAATTTINPVASIWGSFVWGTGIW